MENSNASQFKQQLPNSQSNTKNTKNFMWNDEKSTHLINCLVDEAVRGMKVDKSFKRQAFVAAARAVSEKFGESCNCSNVENRLKTLKKQWATIMKLKNLSGAAFDPMNKIITLGDGSYQDYVKAHPKDAIFLNIPIKFYDQLAIICDDDHATGEFAMDDLGQANLENICETNEGDENINNNNNMDNIEAEDMDDEPRVTPMRSRRGPSANQQDSPINIEATTSCGKSNKKKHRLDSDLSYLVGTLGKIAERMVDPATQHREKLLVAIKAHTDYDENVHLAAFEHCLEHQNEAHLFLARSFQSQADWLYNFMIKLFQI